MSTDRTNSTVKLLGTLAVEKGWVSQEDVLQAVEKQKTGKFFGEVLLSKNLITVEQLGQLLALQQEAEIRTEDFLFGEIAVQNKFVKAQNVIDSIELQKDLKFRKNLGEILIEQKLLTLQQCEAILASQKRILKTFQPIKQNIACPKCKTLFLVSDPDRLRNVRCKRCKYVFEIGNRNTVTIPEPANDSKTDIDEILPNTSKSLSQYLEENDLHPTTNISDSNTFFPKNNDRYILGKEIARGGMGSILMTRDINLRRNIVTKVLLNKKSRLSTLRFIEEAQIIGQLEHPNIPPVYDLGLDKNNHIFFTMKYIKGVSLEDIINKILAGDKHTIAEYNYSNVTNIFIKLCNALAFAHSKKVIHRDIKPENIMIGEYGEVLLMDWGLAKIIGTKEDFEELNEEQVSSIRTENTFSNTIEGTTAGTPAFMSPEQATGQLEDLDEQSDVYSLGATLFCFLALERPVRGKNVQELLDNAAQGNIVSIKTNAPPELKAIALKAMEYEKKNRYKNTKEMELDLIYYQRGFSVSAKQDNLLDTLKKIYQRNTLLTLISSIFFISFISTSIFFIVSLRNQRNEALSQKQIADIAKNNADEALLKAGVAIQNLEKEKRNRLEDNKNAAPNYYAKAKIESQLGKYEEAETLLDTAIEYDNNNPTYRLYRGCIAIANDKYEKAKGDLAFIKNHPNQNLINNLLELLKKNQNEQLTTSQKIMVAEICNSLKFFDISQKLTDEFTKKINIWNIRITESWGKDTFTLSMINNLLTLRINNHNKPYDYNVLRTIPLKDFIITNSLNTNNISFLEGMPLEKVSIINCPLIKDLSPLKGIKISTLELVSCGVRDLSPLSNSNLTNLIIRNCQLATLKPILHLQIKSLEFVNFQLEEPNELKALALENLTLIFFKFKNLDFINPSKLKSITLDSSSLLDISKLKSAPLEYLSINSDYLEDISVLGNKNIEYLSLPKSKIQNFGIVASLRNLRTIIINPNLLQPGWQNILSTMSFQVQTAGISKEQLKSLDKFLLEYQGINIKNTKK